MTYFPVCPPGELMAPRSVPIAALIPGDPQPSLVVPCYPRGECPEPTRFRVSDYTAALPGDYYVPLYSSRGAMMERFSRPVSAITPLAVP